MKPLSGSLTITLLFACTAVSLPAVAAPTYSAINLGDLLGATFSQSRAINDAGQVAGSYGPSSIGAFVTGANGIGTSDLAAPAGSNPRPTGINNVGQIVGSFSQNSTTGAFITGLNGVGFTNLGGLGGGVSAAWAINNTGQVIGYASPTGSTDWHAFITGPNGVGMTDLGTLGAPFSMARGINDAGRVVGIYGDWIASPSLSMFITGPDGSGITPLSSLFGISDYANGINNAGQVVGFTGTSVTVTPNSTVVAGRAFVTGPDGSGMMVLGTLGGDSSWAGAINNAGQVVGNSSVTGNNTPHAFVWDSSEMDLKDLNMMVDLPNGFVLIDATAINDLGQIVAMGSNRQAWLLTPLHVPEPATLALLVMALAGAGFGRRKHSMKAAPAT